jgi:hypothetical protein
MKRVQNNGKVVKRSVHVASTDAGFIDEFTYLGYDFTERYSMHIGARDMMM